MPVPIYFNSGRLLVGWRKRDFTGVWFELGDPEDRDDDGTRRPKDSGDEDKKQEFVFSSDDRQDTWKAPIRGEIMWMPWWDPANCEATTYRSQLMMQKEYLIHAHNYMSEQNPATVRQMEHDFHKPRFVRWQTWFDAARKEKHRRLKTRKRRADNCRAAGVSELEIEQTLSSDVSDHEDANDSAYEDGRDEMPPPARRSANGKKRKTNVRGKQGVGRGEQRSRTEAGAEDDHAYYITGVRGSSRGSVDDDDDLNCVYDIQPPNLNTPPPSGRPAPSRASLEARRRRMNDYRARVEGCDDDEEVIFVDQNDDEQDDNSEWHNTDGYNGAGMDEDEATQRAIRASMAPETPDGDPDRAISSIEGDEDQTMVEGMNSEK